MKNKYLTKIALFGLSKEERLSKRHIKHYIDTHNLYSNHFNAHISETNKDFERKYPQYKEKVLEGDAKLKYLNHVVNTIHSEDNLKTLKTNYDKLHKSYKHDVGSLGGKVQDDYFDTYIHNKKLELLSTPI